MSNTESRTHIEKAEELICAEAIITGDVYEESIVDTHKLIIEGKTHKNSTQFSKYAQINTHQGTLRCHEAKITLVDNGEIHATTVSADTVNSGSIYAQDVFIKHLMGNATIYASNSITIEHMSGENNKLFINYEKIPILISKIDLIEDDIQELNASLEKAKEDNSTLEKEIEIELSRLEEEISTIKNSTKYAKITIEKPIKTKNRITFEINSDKVITYETEEGSFSPFYLDFKEKTITLKPTSQTITTNS